MEAFDIERSLPSWQGKLLTACPPHFDCGNSSLMKLIFHLPGILQLLSQ
jgi:hypothetical protein